MTNKKWVFFGYEVFNVRLKLQKHFIYFARRFSELYLVKTCSIFNRAVVLDPHVMEFRVDHLWLKTSTKPTIRLEQFHLVSHNFHAANLSLIQSLLIWEQPSWIGLMSRCQIKKGMLSFAQCLLKKCVLIILLNHFLFVTTRCTSTIFLSNKASICKMIIYRY